MASFRFKRKMYIAFLAPLVSTAGRFVASGAAKTAAKKVAGQVAEGVIVNKGVEMASKALSGGNNTSTTPSVPTPVDTTNQ